MEIRRLHAEHYGELLTLLNSVFARENHCPGTDFEKDLPKMWGHSEEKMGRHFAAFDGGRMVAALGVYPIPVRVGERSLLFATVGNVATHWDYEGRGCMTALMTRAMEELCEIGADVSRLGGLRSRYGRFGYEGCGTNAVYRLTARNLAEQETGAPLTLHKVGQNDGELLAFISAHCRAFSMYAERPDADLYAILTAWRHVPYVAMEGGRPVGYLVLSRNGKEIPEFGATEEKDLLRVLAAGVALAGGEAEFSVGVAQRSRVRLLDAIAESYCLVCPSRFKILHFAKVADAFLALKAKDADFLPGAATLGITGEPTIRLYCEGGRVGCEETDAAPDLTLSPLMATRLLFGPLPPDAVADAIPAALRQFCPLPLCWNTLDRV